MEIKLRIGVAQVIAAVATVAAIGSGGALYAITSGMTAPQECHARYFDDPGYVPGKGWTCVMVARNPMTGEFHTTNGGSFPVVTVPKS